MIEKIIDWSAKNKFIVLIIYILISVYGIFITSDLPIDAIPDLSENQVIVFTEWNGRSPQLMEDQVTYPISTALQGLAEVKAVRAYSMFSMSFVFVIFNEDVDIYFARNRVQERLSAARDKLPVDASSTMGPDGTGVGHIFWYTLQSKSQDLEKLRTLQDWFLKFQLASVEGVAEVASIGGFIRQYQVDIFSQKLQVYNISVSEIVEAIQKNNNEVGGKIIEQSGAEYYVRAQGYIKNKSDIENIVIKNTKGTPITIKDIGVVQLGAESRRGAIEENGNGEAVGGIIVMRDKQNTAQVIERVKNKMKELENGLPDDVKISYAYDRSVLIKESVDTLWKALIEAGITVALVVMFFIFHFRSILRIIIEIPIVVLISFILMKQFHITSNIMSLGGIILAIGIVVDSSIVLVENAYRNLSHAQKENPNLTIEEYQNISIHSAKQMGRAIFFSELIILISFIPVFFLTGQEGKLFKPLAFTKTFAMISSAIVSITLIPVLMTLLMRGKFLDESQNRITIFFNKMYLPIIEWVLKHKRATIIINVAMLISIVPMIIKIGSEFIPPLDEGSILYMPSTLPNVSMSEMVKILQRQDKIISSVPEVKNVLGKIGRAETATDNAPISMIETIIILKSKDEWRKGITKTDIVNELNEKLTMPGIRNGWTQPIINRINMLSTGVRTDIGLQLFGLDIHTLQELSFQAEQLIKQVNGAADVVADRIQYGYYLDIKVNKELLNRYGASIDDVQSVVETAIGGKNIGTIIDGRMRFALRIRFVQDERNDINELKNIVIPIKVNGDEKKIFLPLSQVAEIKSVEGPSMIVSENGKLKSTVMFNARGKDIGSVVEEAKSIIKNKLQLPQGYSVQWTGQYEQKLEADKKLMVLIPVVFLLIFLMLYFVFQDVKEAGVVMVSVVFALIGGVYMIYFLGYNFSVAVWVGFIALYGIAIETGVVMVLYLHEALDKKIKDFHLGKRGAIEVKDIYDATMEGAVMRLRPKLMTVFTSIIALVPVMWSSGTGADVMKPLTAPMVGGLITSAIHVLVVTPVLFVMMKVHLLKQGKLDVSNIYKQIK